MTQLQIKKATKQQAKARIALAGVSGAGKTYTGLRIARSLGKRVLVIDTENASASKYADEFNFDTIELDTFSPTIYVEALQMGQKAGYDVIVIDSLSHAWMGKDGALEQVDRVTARSQSKNSFASWREVTPLHNALVDAMVHCKSHLIVTMRSKSDYIMREVTRNGRTYNEPVKVGMAPIQRDGIEYEFDVVADIDMDHQLIVTKSRCRALDGAVVKNAGEEIGETLKAWLSDGVPATQESKPQPHPQKPIPQASETISPLQLRRLHSLGKEAYGEGWDEKRAELVKSVSRGATLSSKELTPKEAATLIEGLEKKAIEKRATQEVESYEVPVVATEPAPQPGCDECKVAPATRQVGNKHLCTVCAERATITADMKAKRKPKTAA